MKKTISRFLYFGLPLAVNAAPNIETRKMCNVFDIHGAVKSEVSRTSTPMLLPLLGMDMPGISLATRREIVMKGSGK